MNGRKPFPPEFVSKEDSKNKYFNRHGLFCCDLTLAGKEHLSDNGHLKST